MLLSWLLSSRRSKTQGWMVIQIFNDKDILQVVDSEAARNFKAHMVAIMHAEQNLPLIGKALEPFGNFCTQLASPKAAYCELAVMQNARRALGKGESRQSRTFQVQLLITKGCLRQRSFWPSRYCCKTR